MPAPTEMVLSLLPASLILIAVAVLMQRVKPVWPNTWYGYRTPLSTSTKALFDEGNRYSARMLLRIGVLNAVANAALLCLPLHTELGMMYGVMASAALLLASLGVMIALTEMHLRKQKREGELN